MRNPAALKPLVVAFVADLNFAMRIEGAAQAAGFAARLVGAASELAPGHEIAAGQGKPGEPLAGAAGQLVETLTRWQPALLIFDLDNEEIPWRAWLAVVKSSAATRRIPAIAFGPHVQVDKLTAAKDAGAEAVLARSAFVRDLPHLLQKHARVPDYAGIGAGCAGELSALAREGLHLFNTGEYFEAHEVLEHAWNEDASPARELYRAILQVAVAYLQIERGNYAGAVKMFLRVRQWLGPLPDVCRGVDVAQLRTDAGAVEAALLAGGPEGIATFDRSLFQPVQYSA